MKPFRTILFAADFSEASHEAFSMACSLAVEGETKIHVLHVDEPNWVPEEPAAFGQPIQFWDDEKDGSHTEDLSTHLASAYTPSRPVDIEYHTQHGEAAAEILRLAEEVDADLIVSGTHGRTGLSWMLAGSVATSVMRGSRCPVLVVRSSEWLRDGKPNQFILHPTDFSENSEEALRVARTMARELGVRLVIYHVAPFDVYLSDMIVPADPHVYQDALEQMRRRVDGQDLKYPVEIRHSQGDPAEEIIRAAGEADCGLIVMGTHGRTGLARLLMGSVAEFVLPRADCPVLAVKTLKTNSETTAKRPSDASLRSESCAAAGFAAP